MPGAASPSLSPAVQSLRQLDQASEMEYSVTPPGVSHGPHTSLPSKASVQPTVELSPLVSALTTCETTKHVRACVG
jgi:hypothetical protein